MVACARAEMADPRAVDVFHIWNRVVRRARLCGEDPYTGKNYDYRRDWITGRERLLAQLFGIDVAFHAELSNQIRAGEASTPEESTHTSAYDRIDAHTGKQTEAPRTQDASPQPARDSWLCPLTLAQGLNAPVLDGVGSTTAWRASGKGIIRLSLAQYLQHVPVTVTGPVTATVTTDTDGYYLDSATFVREVVPRCLWEWTYDGSCSAVFLD